MTSVVFGSDNARMAADIGTRIKKRRQVLGWTQEELTVRLGVSKSTVANWESGKHFPLRHLGAVEAVLGVSLDESEEPGPLDDLKPWQHDWERLVAEEEYLPDDIKRRMIEDWRRARSEARARRQRPRNGATATGAA